MLLAQGIVLMIQLKRLGKLFNLSETTKLSNSDILRQMDSKLTHLQESEQEDIRQLTREYFHLFPDVPSRTNMIAHDVDVGDAAPVKQHPYRLNPSKQEYLNNEIQYLLENDLIEPSQSSWSLILSEYNMKLQPHKRTRQHNCGLSFESMN